MFEGSYLGGDHVLQAHRRLECKIDWWVYDPAQGAPIWNVSPGSPLADLPKYWKYPVCDGPHDQFMIVPD
ncbi:Rubredoxin [Paraburkholderia piptadeniae]|uniref:Rubredoxin n=1 Tax=Paraburkholderia piptadeniae TaxID=1701573 RepID=A0A1N7SXU1_9BURK|nr:MULTISPECIES: rubredoxin [Paraburkholderia]SIT52201.1 Rubredoxin [Paraburkholderia piptadeniae]